MISPVVLEAIIGFRVNLIVVALRLFLGEIGKQENDKDSVYFYMEMDVVCKVILLII
jgi:hypothetical protein